MAVLALDLPDLSTFTTLGFPYDLILPVIALAWAVAHVVRQVFEAHKSQCDVQLKKIEIAALERQLGRHRAEVSCRNSGGIASSSDEAAIDEDVRSLLEEIDKEYPLCPRGTLVRFIVVFVVISVPFLLPPSYFEIDVRTLLWSAVFLVALMLAFVCELLMRFVTKERYNLIIYSYVPIMSIVEILGIRGSRLAHTVEGSHASDNITHESK